MGEVAYAVLWHHDVDEPHFDLLIETYSGSELATWRSAVWPIEKPAALTRLKDHRRIYLSYEGELSERRGSVERVAEGRCELSINEGAVWVVRFLDGRGRLVLRQIAGELWEGCG